MVKKWKTIADIRREYGGLSLQKSKVKISPFEQFEEWFAQVLISETHDPTAMVLSTIDSSGKPDSRVVLLKGIYEHHFVFYTNYQSSKALDIEHNKHVAINFYWPQTARQVRIRGTAMKATSEQSNAYFASRPRESQLSAIASPQSQEIEGRQILESHFEALAKEYHDKTVQRPEHWGGYVLEPYEFEFWQGRDNRLHDRIKYSKKQSKWTITRLAP